MIDAELGHWTEGALRNLPGGQGTWSGIKGRGYSYFIVGEVRGQKDWKIQVASIRRQLNNIGWIGRIEGFEWTITSDMGTARFQQIPTTTPLTHTPSKLFKTSAAAKAEIESILASRPDHD